MIMKAKAKGRGGQGNARGLNDVPSLAQAVDDMDAAVSALWEKASRNQAVSDETPVKLQAADFQALRTANGQLKAALAAAGDPTRRPRSLQLSQSDLELVFAAVRAVAGAERRGDEHDPPGTTPTQPQAKGGTF